jgi:protein gp37
MAETTKIEWADATFNPWTGCQAISPGCDHCYADAWAKRAGREFHIRKRTTEANWRTPLKWQRDAQAFFDQHGRRQRVFCASLADVFDNEAAPAWRMDLFNLIESTPDLDWLLLTKRIGNVLNFGGRHGLREDIMRERVWLGATIVNQAEADRDIPKLLRAPAKLRFLSCEPLLGPIDLQHVVLKRAEFPERGQPDVSFPSLTGWFGGHDSGSTRIDWVIAGGESGHGARPTHPYWALSLRDQCAAAHVPLLFKQWGEHMPADDDECDAGVPPSRLFWSDGSSWIESDGQRGGVHLMARVGKKAAGRLLDGREHNEFPKAIA